MVICIVVMVALAGCAKAKLKLFDRDRAMTAQPIAKDSRDELIDGFLLQGLNHLQKGDLAAAAREFKQHLKENPKSAMAHYHLGLIELDEDHFEKARAHFEKSLMLWPKMYGAASNLGVLYLRNGEDAAAMRRLEEAEAVNPTDPRVIVNLANARMRRQLWSEAVEGYREANTAVADHASVMYNLALALHVRHRYKEALVLLDDAVMHRPGFQLARALRVSCLQGAGRVKDAIASARQSLAEVEATSDLEIVLGRALLSVGKVKAGVEAFERAVSLDKSDPNALLALAESLDATGKRSRAAKLYRRYLGVRVRDLQDSRRVRKRLKTISG